MFKGAESNFSEELKGFILLPCNWDASHGENEQCLPAWHCCEDRHYIPLLCKHKVSHYWQEEKPRANSKGHRWAGRYAMSLTLAPFKQGPLEFSCQMSCMNYGWHPGAFFKTIAFLMDEVLKGDPALPSVPYPLYSMLLLTVNKY